MARVGDVPPGGSLSVRIGERRVAIFDDAGELHALEDECLHQSAPIAGGEIEAGVVSCPWHGWQFELRSGRCVLGPPGCIARFAVKVEGDEILVSEDPVPR